MLFNKRNILIAGAGLALSVSSCKKFMDVNTNPNVSQVVTVQTLLPAAQLRIGSAMGTDLQIAGSIWAQYWTQAPVGKQYASWEQYNPAQDAFANAWTNLYAGAENFYQLTHLADTQNKKQYEAIALLMRAYTFQVITDGWGDVPFKQSLQGQYADGHITSPRYDSQMVVYNGILANIDTADKLMSIAGGSRPGGDDLIYGGDMSKWQKFSNTLRLKVLMRMAYVDPVGAQAKVTTLFTRVPKPLFIGTGDDARISYGATAANKNPLAAEESSALLSGVQNLAGSKTAIDAMNAGGDPRVTVFYEPTASGYKGVAQSEYTIPLPAGSYSIPNVYVGGDVLNPASANAPVNLLTSWESYFLQAEVAARNWAPTGSTDVTLFYAGVKASFDYYATALSNSYTPTTGSAYNDYVSGTGTWANYPAGGTVAQRVRYIITQKWFAMCGNQGFEAWTELRRTGYPDFLVHPLNSVIGTNRPRRLLYPTTESTGNTSFPVSGVLPVTSYVWWNLASVNW